MIGSQMGLREDAVVKPRASFHARSKTLTATIARRDRKRHRKELAQRAHSETVRRYGPQKDLILLAL